MVELVNAMDGLNRLRFAGDAERLAAWESASAVIAPARAPQEVKPAA